jgi:hypothetical protein
MAGCEGSTRSDAFDAAGPGAAGDASSGVDPDSPGDGRSTDSPGDGSSGAAPDDGSGPLLDVGAPDPDDPGGIPGEGCQYIDALFVVDISASMTEEKANLAANFPHFVQVLDDYVAAGGALGYRLGVTNSSINADYDGCATTMGFDGALTAAGGAFGGDCGTGGTPWLDGPAAGLADNFSCLANNPIPPGGGSDCGKERPLGVIERFVDKAAAGGPNDGFYRGDDSLLVIVNLTDEDEDQDWTDTTPAQTKAKLDAFATGEERYVVVNIAGPMACQSQFGEAIEASVLKQFTALVPNGLFGDICQGDLAQPLADALDLIQSSCDALPPPEG